jgi:hypothetical protein
MLTKFKNWFTQLLKKVADKLNLRKLTPDEKFESFANKVLGDLFGGKDITEKQEGKKGDLQLMKIGGKEVQVRRLPEQLDVVNGFYSPLEKMLLETKFDKLPVKQWIEKFGKSEEAKWTGLSDWLSQQQGSVSKADIQQYLKDNRIEVVEVVKGEKGQKMMSKSEARKVFEDNGYDVVTDKNGDTYVEKNEEIFDYNDMSELEKSAFDALTINNSDRVSAASDTIFYKYQLEGEKENYKEILVTLPSKDINAISNYNVIVNEEKSFLDKISGMPTDEQRTIYNDIKKRKADAEKLLPKNSFIGNHGFANTNAKEFKSTHFDEPNILVHLRMNTRKDSQGNKVLFLEEIQSDWGQKGKREGFVEKLEPITKNNSTIEKINDRESDFAYKLNYKGKDLAFVFNDEKHLFKNQSEIDNVLIHRANRDYARSQQDKTPSAPFVMDTNAWTKLALKVALKEAVKQGEQMQRTAFEKLVDEKMDWVEARMKKLGKLEVKCP